MKEYFPDAGEDQINRLLGIRYPGEMKKKANAPKKEKTRQPKEWVIPANPRYYDIEAAFTFDNEIVWKQGAGINQGIPRILPKSDVSPESLFCTL
jgi:hypothetical protein